MEYNKFDLGQTIYTVGKNGYILRHKVIGINIKHGINGLMVEYNVGGAVSVQQQYAFVSKEEALENVAMINGINCDITYRD